jgi:site-specific recombinase
MQASLSSYAKEKIESVLRQIGQDPRTDRIARLRVLASLLAAEQVGPGLHWVCDLLDREPVWRDALGQLLAGELLSGPLCADLADVGLASGQSLLAQTLGRIGRKIVPPVVPASGAQAVLHALAGAGLASAELQADELQAWARLIALLSQSPAWAPEGAAADHVREELQSAMQWIALRAASATLSPDLQTLIQPARLDSDVFIGLPAAVSTLTNGEPPGRSRADLLARLSRAETLVAKWREAVRESGTTAALTHELRSLRDAVIRLRQIVLALDEDEGAPARRTSLLLDLLAARAQHGSLRALIRRSSADLAYRMTESASQSGEHYVANSRTEWAALLRAACVAGVVVAFMAILKIKIAAAHFPPLWEALFVCLNYGLGFVFIHMIHGTVATKQPAMTAAVLARRLAEDDGTPLSLQRTADLCVKMARSQTVAIAGNVLMAVPVAALLAALWPLITGHSLINDTKAAGFLADASVWAGPSLLFAAVAGTCLFLAGMISGWFDNFAAVTRLSSRLAVHPALLRLLGARRAARVGNYAGEHLGALSGNLLFGFLLGGVSFLGALTGTGLDIRHVAFSSANTAFAVVHGGQSMALWWIPLFALGVLSIGAMNVAVSFGLSLFMAVRARGASGGRIGLLLRLLGRRMLRTPPQFLVPPREPAPAERRDEAAR